jgi:tetratricopeptide (TPR) repeat protein
MAKWAKFPHDQKAILYVGDALKKNWDALHKGDNEPFPKDANLIDAWRAYHAGNFADAVEAGEGTVVAAKAMAIYANYLEPKDSAKVGHYQAAMEIADKLRAKEGKNINAHYQFAYAAGRYSQSISIIKALKEANTAMGAYHAEIIDKVGGMVGKLTYGASKDAAVEHFEKALKLTPQSPIAHIEYANGLLMLFGDKEMDKATKLYEKAAKMKGKDAMEMLDIEMAKEELEDE